ncbi:MULTISPECIES: hypothetical protein [unclassified Coleofasciculus]|uniref:hypothetical protein n=1 Tax=unclassified Coleofasciculus TaxID=2692782 RepID=UPI001883066C|nr:MULTISPECIES: hypothetical protein [unclassified Coleofasciculus]MBE9130098.1 hypothetical protein [Coleofasciculus sp. LEGE 07081]MBE9150674.1 hypothetical protein [Coleofasciculus sp. LEGE 07092]
MRVPFMVSFDKLSFRGAEPFVLGLLLFMVSGAEPLCQSALASDILRQSSGQVVQVKIDSTQTPEIGLAQGSGVNITFIPTGRIIQKVWLDDPTWVVMDVDGCLVGYSAECDRPTATTVHLKRINPLRIEGFSTTGRSLLTIITSGESGDLKISTFRIVQKNNPGVQIVEIIPSLGEEDDENNF